MLRLSCRRLGAALDTAFGFLMPRQAIPGFLLCLAALLLSMVTPAASVLCICPIAMVVLQGAVKEAIRD